MEAGENQLLLLLLTTMVIMMMIDNDKDDDDENIDGINEDAAADDTVQMKMIAMTGDDVGGNDVDDAVM